MTGDGLLTVSDLTKHFPVKKRTYSLRVRHFIHAVDGLSFSVGHGEIFGLVGESGCGKTTTGKLIVKLLPPTGARSSFTARTCPRSVPGASSARSDARCR